MVTLLKRKSMPPAMKARLEEKKYPYKINGERVEFFHWHIDKTLRALGDWHREDGPILNIQRASHYAAKVLDVVNIPDLIDCSLNIMDEEFGRERLGKDPLPKGFTIAICGEVGTIAFCSDKDIFSKKRGRAIVMGRLQKEKDKFRFYVYDPEKYNIKPLPLGRYDVSCFCEDCNS